MHPQAIAGFLCAWLLAYVAIGAYCIAAYLRRGRKTDYLLFGLLTFALAVLNAGEAWHYVAENPLEVPQALTLATAGRIAATVLLFHFVLDYAEIRWRRYVIGVLYGVAAVFSVANLLGLFFEFENAHHHPIALFGTSLSDVFVPDRAAAALFSVLAIAAVLAAAAILARTFVSGRLGALALFLGSVVLAVGSLHDGLRGAGLVHGPVLGPYGYEAFVLGVILTLQARYTAMRDKLEAKTVELKQRSQELGRSYEELREAQSELVRKEQLAAVGELAAVIAHEVRNPLAIINNAVATLRREGLGVDDRQTLHGILEEESSRLNRLVGDLLRYARPVSLERQLLSVRDLVERALSLAQTRTDITVELVEPDPVPRIWGDPNLLRQVIENLTTNALQAMSSGGALTATLVRQTVDGAEGVELMLEDTGEGMDTTVRNRALDPFFTTRPSGTGLGLAIVVRIVDAHGGRLHIRSAAGAGTILHVFLPVASDGAPAVRRGRNSEPRISQSSLPPMPVELRRVMGGRRS